MVYFLESDLYKDILKVVKEQGFKESDMKIVYTGDHNDFNKLAYIEDNGLYEDEIFPLDFKKLSIFLYDKDHKKDIAIKIIKSYGEIGVDYIISIFNLYFDIENVVSFELLNKRSNIQDRSLFIKLNKEHLPVKSYNKFDEVYIESFNIYDSYLDIFKYYNCEYFINDNAKYYEGEVERFCSMNDIIMESKHKNIVVFLRSYNLITEFTKNIDRDNSIKFVHMSSEKK